MQTEQFAGSAGRAPTRDDKDTTAPYDQKFNSCGGAQVVFLGQRQQDDGATVDGWLKSALPSQMLPFE